MPKEIIRDPISSDFRIETSWGRHGGCVQVATVATDGDRRTLSMLNEVLADVDLPELDADDLMKRALRRRTPQTFTGWHVTITDREQINELIRQLRRARDHAFGRDE